MGRPALDTAKWIALARKTHGSRYDYSRVRYNAYRCYVDIICPEHGVFTQLENNHRNGAGCPSCGLTSRAKKRSHTFESFLAAARARHGERYQYPEQRVVNNRQKIRAVCADHGEFAQHMGAHLLGRGCQKCRYSTMSSKLRVSPPAFIIRARAVHGDRFEYPEEYRGMHEPLSISCRKHGLFAQLPASHLKGSGCPRCANHISRGEQELQAFVTALCDDTQLNTRKVIKPYELDVYVPSKNVAVEYNGLWFHREDFAGDKSRLKWRACDAEGIKLVQVFEDEWLRKRPLVEQRLRAILGVAEKRYARKCTLKATPLDEARAFVAAHHTQGSRHRFAKAYGLYEGDKLVAVATFGEGRFRNSGWELLRYCSEGQVVGGISRLVAAFQRDMPVDVISYADLRWGSGESYASAGFTPQGITVPDYWWADTSKLVRISRYSLQRLKGDLSEREYAAQQGWHRILGVGHKKWLREAPRHQPPLALP